MDATSAPDTARFAAGKSGLMRLRPDVDPASPRGEVAINGSGNGTFICRAIQARYETGCVSIFASPDCTPSPMLSPSPTSGVCARTNCPVRRIERTLMARIFMLYISEHHTSLEGTD